MYDQDPLHAARTKLEAERRRVCEEISTYPSPISGCDAQFNYLLDIRRRFERALAALDEPHVIPTPRTPH